MINQLNSFIPEVTKTNLILKGFSLLKVPLLFITGAKVIKITEQECEVRMPFNKIVKNHLGSVYFGALSIGADACVGLLAVHQILKTKKKVNLVFKSFKADFLKRAEGPVIFRCEQGDDIKEMISKTLNSGERITQPIKAQAIVHGEVVAEFVLELSLKKRS